MYHKHSSSIFTDSLGRRYYCSSTGQRSITLGQSEFKEVGRSGLISWDLNYLYAQAKPSNSLPPDCYSPLLEERQSEGGNELAGWSPWELTRQKQMGEGSLCQINGINLQICHHVGLTVANYWTRFIASVNEVTFSSVYLFISRIPHIVMNWFWSNLVEWRWRGRFLKTIFNIYIIKKSGIFILW